MRYISATFNLTNPSVDLSVCCIQVQEHFFQPETPPSLKRQLIMAI